MVTRKPRARKRLLKKLYEREQSRNMKPNTLTEKSSNILEALAKGLSFEEILVEFPALTYHDIFRALGGLPDAAAHAASGKGDRHRLRK